MTRINVGIHPKYLIDQHLIAELGEISRPLTNIIKQYTDYRIDNPDTPRSSFNLNSVNIPKSFKLGEGHVKYFYDKMFYLHKRFLALQLEYLRRFKKVTQNKFDIPEFVYECGLYNDVRPSLIHRDLLCIRIKERITNMSNKPRYEGVNISKERAIYFIDRTSNPSIYNL